MMQKHILMINSLAYLEDVSMHPVIPFSTYFVIQCLLLKKCKRGFCEIDCGKLGETVKNPFDHLP